MPKSKKKTKKTKAKESPKQSFGDRLTALRKAAGFTQQQLADEIGTTRRIIGYYETQSRYPPAHILQDLAQTLNVSTDQLLGFKLIPNNNKPHGNSQMMRRLKDLEQLPAKEQRAVFQLIDAFIAQHKSKKSA